MGFNFPFFANTKQTISSTVPLNTNHRISRNIHDHQYVQTVSNTCMSNRVRLQSVRLISLTLIFNFMFTVHPININ